MKVFVLELKQDDPTKCTAAKLIKFNLVQSRRFIPKNTIVLNPLSKMILSKTDINLAKSICAIDCSWNYFNETIVKLKIIKKRINRRLPFLLAGNPINYAKLGKLTTAEAIAGSLYILGFKSYAEELLNKFKWGHTFLDLNFELLELYKDQENPNEILRIEKEYFPNLY
jgi:pre-rRNA-processing protein TSR3